MLTILWTLFIGCWLWQLLYWGIVLLKTRNSSENRYTTNQETEVKPVSIIICARNEVENLKKNLFRILNQSYRCFEIVLVNDHSEDNTSEFIYYVKKKAPNLVLVNLEGDKDRASGKKGALLAGIAAARYEHLLLTDADCYPTSDQWLSKMAAAFGENRSIVLGISPLDTVPGCLGALQQFETWFTYAQYCSWAQLGFPYMGVGRNLAYKKELVSDPALFAGVDHLLSGDDDLIVNRLAKAENVAIITDAQAMTRSPAPTTWRAWWRQKRRHLSVSSYYRPWQIVILGGTNSTWGILHITGIALLIADFQWIILILFGLRWLYMSWSIRTWTHKNNEHIPIIRVPALDFMYAAYVIAMVPTLILKPVEWN